jgi:prolyl 4-hydroxylase
MIFQLERAQTTVDFSKSQVAHNRTAKLTWLDDSDSPLVEKLSKRIEYLTGLTTETSELLQTQNYGVGGHYEFHTDFLQGFWDDPELGDRIATFMFYVRFF